MSAARIVVVAALVLAPAARADEPALDVSNEATLKGAGIGTDGPALLDFFRKRTLSRDQQAKLPETVRRLGNDSFAVREKASADLMAAGLFAVPLLQAVLQDPDPEIARRAELCLKHIQGGTETHLVQVAAALLAARRPAGATEVVLNYLPCVDDAEIEEQLLATLAGAGVKDGKADPLLAKALTDGVPARRSAAAFVLGQLRDTGQRAAVLPLLADPDPKVVLRAAQGLVTAGEKQAVPALINLLDAAPVELAWQAEELLGRIAGEQAPAVTVGSGDTPGRRKCRQAWEGWWQERGAKIDWSRLDLEQRSLGLTLIVACVGRVWECGMDGKARWELKTVQYPVDAQVVSGQRVLVAEQAGRRVTERDHQGKILWQYAVNDSLVTCQRLRGGNTLVATYHEIFELTPQGQKVFTHAVPNEVVYSARKLQSGNVVYLLGTGRLIEIDAHGTQVKTLALTIPATGLIKFDVLPGGRYLVPQIGKVTEIDREGKILWQCNSGNANSVRRLPNGNTLLANFTNKEVVEVNRAGKVVWQQHLDGGVLLAQRR